MTAIRTEQSCKTIMKIISLIIMFLINKITYGLQHIYLYVLFWYLKQNIATFLDFISYYTTLFSFGKRPQLGSWVHYPKENYYAYHEQNNGPSGSNSITFVPRWQIWLRFFGNRIDSSCFDGGFKFRSCLFFLFKVGQIPFPGNHGLPTFPKLNESSGWKKTSRF